MRNLVTPNTSDTRHIAGDDWFHQASWMRSRLGTTISNCSSSSPGKNPNILWVTKDPNPETPHNSAHWKLDFLCLCQKCSIQVFLGGRGVVELPGIFPKHFFGAGPIPSSSSFMPRNPSCWPLLRRLPWKNFRESHGLGNRLHQRTCPGRCKRC